MINFILIVILFLIVMGGWTFTVIEIFAVLVIYIVLAVIVNLIARSFL